MARMINKTTVPRQRRENSSKIRTSVPVDCGISQNIVLHRISNSGKMSGSPSTYRLPCQRSDIGLRVRREQRNGSLGEKDQRSASQIGLQTHCRRQFNGTRDVGRLSREKNPSGLPQKCRSPRSALFAGIGDGGEGRLVSAEVPPGGEGSMLMREQTTVVQ